MADPKSQHTGMLQLSLWLLSSVVGDLKKRYVNFLESSIEFYASLVEQLQPTEGSLGDSQSRRKVIDIDIFTPVIV